MIRTRAVDEFRKV